jgi:virulence-associated protein VapD
MNKLNELLSGIINEQDLTLDYAEDLKKASSTIENFLRMYKHEGDKFSVKLSDEEISCLHNALRITEKLSSVGY